MSVEKNPRDEMWELKVKEKKDQLTTELIRYKQDCRKRALDAGVDAANRTGSAFSVKTALVKADEYYEWLTKDLS